MWDDDTEYSPVPSEQNVSRQTTQRGSNQLGSGISIGRGRGFGNFSSMNNALPSVGSQSAIQQSSNTTSSNGMNDDWDEGGSQVAESSVNNSSWEDNRKSSWKPEKSTAQSGWGKSNDDDWNEDTSNSGWNENSDRKGWNESNDKGGRTWNSSRSNNSESTWKKSGDGWGNKDRGESGARGGQGRGSECYKCGKDGHMSRECPNPGKQDKKTCYKCGDGGHMARDCPNADSSRGERKSNCFRCNEEGHISKDCPNADSNRGEKKSGCYRCNEDGHIAKDCTNADTRTGPDGKPRAAPYVPPEPSEDENSLFESVPTGINFSKYDSIPVDVTGNRKSRPIFTFEDANFCPLLSRNISRSNYIKPTPVQKYAIPIIMEKRDLMACAQTGSGKTAAFLLPMIQEMCVANDLPNNSYKNTQEPWAVIIAPTRELAIQIFNEARKFSHGSIVKTELLYGGTSTGYQSSRLQKGCHILVATPGRLLDFIEKGKVSFSQLRYLVLDEADRMLDMGFIPDVRKMVGNSEMPPKGQRHTLMFSATFPEEIQMLASEFLEDYLFLTVGMVGAANTDVEQAFFKLGQYDKRQKLMDILGESGSDRTLVFVEQKRTADFIASYASQNSFPTTSIHGDRLQKEREEALGDFRSGRMPVLVATAVAARGLDIKDVRHVINYDLPQSIDEYVHRIGRTGRVGNLGKATSFYDSSVDQPLARSLMKILEDAQQEVPEWLVEEATHAVGTTSHYSGRGHFGSRDVRNQGRSNRGGGSDAWNNDFSSSNGGGFSGSTDMSQPLASDEAWD